MRQRFWTLLAFAAVLATGTAAQGDTLDQALAAAYANSQALNASRAQLRATDENVPQARAGLRPRVNGTIDTSLTRSRTTRGDNLPRSTSRIDQIGFGVEVSQTLFDGFQTPNNVAAARAQVLAAQENLANDEQNVLLDAATAYMNVLRDRRISALRRQNLEFLQEQVRAARARFEVGEGTRTDVAQAESQQALATALLNTSLAEVAASEATYFDVIGEAPDQLADVRVPMRLLPRSVEAAFDISQQEHPAILATLHAVDAAGFQVKSEEGATLPNVDVVGRLQNQYTLNETDPSNLPGVSVQTQNEVTTTIGAQITIPLYQGGLVSSRVRQSKEVLGQRRIEVDGTRDQVRAAVATSWAQLQAAMANVTGYGAQVEAARLALSGVIEERNVGQRTTLDVLNAQADVITAQILLVGSQRDEVVAGYALMSSVGQLSATRLGVAGGDPYEPEEHYQAVEDAWYGLRTPDGR